jgi:hypothetical protein
MGGEVSNNKDIPLKTTSHYSTIPLFPGPDLIYSDIVLGLGSRNITVSIAGFG